MAGISRAIGALTAALTVAGALCLFGLVATTVVAVIARYLFNDPIFGIEDVSSMLLTVVVAASVAHGARRGAHLSVNVLGRLAGRRATRITDVVVRGLGAVAVGIAAHALVVKGSCGFTCGAFTPNLEILHRPFYFVLALAMGLYTVQIVLHFVVGLQHFSGDDPNDLAD